MNVLKLGFLFFLAQLFLASSLGMAADSGIAARVTGGFAAGTKVLTANDEWWKIDDIMRFWKMTTFSENLKPEEARVVETYSHHAYKAFILEFHGVDDPITLADDQVVLKISQGMRGSCHWEKAKDLKPGDDILSLNAQHTVKIKAITTIPRNTRVWNLELDKTHVFAVGEKAQIIVHNAAFVIFFGIQLLLEGLTIVAVAPVIAPLALLGAGVLAAKELERQKLNGSLESAEKLPNRTGNIGYGVGDSVDFGRFKEKRVNGKKNILHDDKTKEYLERDDGKGNPHGGSYWKLKDRDGNRIASVTEDGIILRK